MPSTLDGRLKEQSPFSRWEVVDVTFGAANTDRNVPHTLDPDDPDAVTYQVIDADRATSVFRDTTGTRKPWQPGYIILQSSVANAKVRLLLGSMHGVRSFVK